MAQAFNEHQVRGALSELPGWSADGVAALTMTYKFKDHVTAMGFLVRVAMVAEKMDHHPDIRIVYSTVDVRLNSHDAGGVTERDVKLAEAISEQAAGGQ